MGWSLGVLRCASGSLNIRRWPDGSGSGPYRASAHRSTHTLTLPEGRRGVCSKAQGQVRSTSVIQHSPVLGLQGRRSCTRIDRNRMGRNDANVCTSTLRGHWSTIEGGKGKRSGLISWSWASDKHKTVLGRCSVANPRKSLLPAEQRPQTICQLLLRS